MAQLSKTPLHPYHYIVRCRVVDSLQQSHNVVYDIYLKRLVVPTSAYQLDEIGYMVMKSRCQDNYIRHYFKLTDITYLGQLCPIQNNRV